MTTRLEDLMDRAGAALLRGDLSALSDLTPEIEAESERIPQDRQLAERLRSKADRNARLLQAAGRGVRAAKARLGEITAGPVLTTYDARGRREAFAPLSALAPRRF